VYIFSDVERLRPPWREFASDVWTALAAAPGGVTLLNHPMRSLRRLDLLERLRDLGVNDFRAWPVSVDRQPQRFPVFLRRPNDHDGARSALLGDQAAFDEALAQLERAGERREDLIIVEFCDTAGEDGLYRKYSAFVVQDQVIPRHVFFGRDWMLKAPQLLQSHLLEEERRYIEANPHAPQIASIFDTASIQYGRIDYAVTRDGRLQVWEINTNPFISSSQDGGGALRGWVSDEFSRRFNGALAELSGRPLAAGPDRVSVPAPTNWPGPGWPPRLVAPGWRGRLARRLLRASGLGPWEGPIMRLLQRLRHGPRKRQP
jgi:hypothetical protein